MKRLFDFFSFPFRLIFVVLVTIIDSILGLLGLLFLRNYYFKLMHYRSWAKRLLFFSGVKVEVTGLENIDLSQSYVFVANHSSYFDIPVIFVAIPINLRIMYKKELERIPIFGWYLKYSDFIAIEREVVGSARSSLNQALELIQKDVSVLIFPEGTRSLDGKLKEFKKGAMFLAVRSGKPIVPVAIVGTYDLLPRGKWYFKSGKVRIVIGTPFEISPQSGKNDLKEITSRLAGTISFLIEDNKFKGI
ncbi:MAG: 1-acyl-sn-glycerol-3-phosphate acyltransferase [Ignavibacteria bacterium]|nr:1-acyl-sn-glycerol-3-phosphate acyltransferase [Ignavibacteria bacterium]